jgi:carbon monoxide dehydrogenase subunit G
VKLEHSFTVPVGIDEAWRILLDIERIGPCMPGAAIDSVDGDDFTGTVKVKLGPIGLTYKGKASFIEKDEAAHRAIIDARGKDSRGNGTASAKVTAVLTEQGGSTKVDVNTDLDITGKPAQFGRGVMVDVGNKLIGQFADSLASTITSGEGEATGMAESSGGAEAASEPAKAAPRKRTPRPKPSAAAAEKAPPAAEAAPAAPSEPAVTAAAESAAVADPVVDEAALEAVAEAPAAYAAPSTDAAGAASVNGHEAQHARPQRDVEPINLIESAGPAVAKRLAPVAIALILVLGAARRRRKKRKA